MYIYDVFLKTKEKLPDKTVLVCDNETYSYIELNHLIVELGNKLISYNIMSCSKVGIIIDEPVKFIITLLAVNYANAVAIPIYSKTGSNKIKQLVDNFQINYLISDVQVEFLGNDTFENVFLNDLNIYEFCFTNDKNTLNDVELILFSSGTTNMPKAIMLTQNSIQANFDGISDYLDITERDRILLIKNLVHASSLIGELFLSFFNGCTVYLTRKIPTPAVIISLLRKYEITIFFAVPTILISLMDYFNRSSFELPSLRVINFYGAKMPKKDVIALIKIFVGVNIIYSYGLTEASPRVTYIKGNDLLLKPASSGKPIRNVSVKISNITDNVNGGNIGEITVKGPNIMKGYYMNAELTNRVLKDDILFTGDLGYLDKDGYLYVTGRKDNMIITSGKNVYPEEIEEVLLHYKGIQEALVKGEYNRVNLLEINAYIVLEPVGCFDKESLYKYLKLNLENYKVPKNVYIIKELEKTASGKIIRH